MRGGCKLIPVKLWPHLAGAKLSLSVQIVGLLDSWFSLLSAFKLSRCQAKHPIEGTIVWIWGMESSMKP